MMGGDVFDIPKDEANLLSGKSGLVFIPSIGGLINISSISYIVPKEKVENNENSKIKKLSNGNTAIKRFGHWYLASNPDIRVDSSYFPEIKDRKNDSFTKLIA